MRFKRIFRIAYHTVVLAVGFVMIYPLLWMVMGSFKRKQHDLPHCPG